MSLNCAEIDQIIREIPLNGLIRAVSQNTNNEIFISYTTKTEKKTLYITINDGETGIFCIPEDEPEEMPKGGLRFANFIEAHCKGGRIVNVEQPEHSRIVVITVQTVHEKYQLIARLWGTGSNMLITESNGVIIECARRYPKRNEWPGEEFIFPQKKEGKIQQYEIRRELVTGSVNDDLYKYYQKQKEEKELAASKKRLTRQIESEIETLETTIRQAKEQAAGEKIELYKQYGDLIMSALYRITRGDPQVEAEDFETGTTILVPLNPELSPQENALHYYEKYKKSRAGREIWEKRYTEAARHQERYEILLENVESAETLADLENIEKALKKKELPVRVTEKAKLPYRRFILSGDYIAYVSRSAREADLMLKTIARGNDYWFHIRDNSGSHVVVKNKPGVELTDRVKLEAAMLALHFSKSRGEIDGDIYFTLIKYLHKPNTNTPGLVFPTQEKNIRVKKDPYILENILKSVET